MCFLLFATNSAGDNQDVGYKKKSRQLNYSMLSTFITKMEMSNYKDKNQESILDGIYKVTSDSPFLLESFSLSSSLIKER